MFSSKYNYWALAVPQKGREKKGASLIDWSERTRRFMFAAMCQSPRFIIKISTGRHRSFAKDYIFSDRNYFSSNYNWIIRHRPAYVDNNDYNRPISISATNTYFFFTRAPPIRDLRYVSHFSSTGHIERGALCDGPYWVVTYQHFFCSRNNTPLLLFLNICLIFVKLQISWCEEKLKP